MKGEYNSQEQNENKTYFISNNLKMTVVLSKPYKNGRYLYLTIKFQ